MSRLGIENVLPYVGANGIEVVNNVIRIIPSISIDQYGNIDNSIGGNGGLLKCNNIQTVAVNPDAPLMTFNGTVYSTGFDFDPIHYFDCTANGADVTLGLVYNVS